MELQEKILNAAIDEFQNKGLKFTMDDVAKRLRVSKKKLYQVFPTKEDMFTALTEYCFADIKKSESEIANHPTLSTVEKIEKIMIVMPERYQNIGLSNLYQLNEKYPDVYKRVASHLESDWDVTIQLLEQGIKEGSIRNVPIPIIKAMVEGTIQHFLNSSMLYDHKISYEEALGQMIQILMQGIVEKK
jgi:AcrR family transcriptional regulator